MAVAEEVIHCQQDDPRIAPAQEQESPTSNAIDNSYRYDCYGPCLFASSLSNTTGLASTGPGDDGLAPPGGQFTEIRLHVYVMHSLAMLDFSMKPCTKFQQSARIWGVQRCLLTNNCSTSLPSFLIINVACLKSRPGRKASTSSRARERLTREDEHGKGDSLSAQLEVILVNSQDCAEKGPFHLFRIRALGKALEQVPVT